MFNPQSRASNPAHPDAPAAISPEAIPLAVAIVTDDHATAQALATACEFMPAYQCRVRVAALRDDPAEFGVRPDEILIVDAANARDRRLDPARHPASPCIFLTHGAPEEAEADLTSAHARLLFRDLSPVALELAVGDAQRNCRALMLARRKAEALERAALAARDGQRRILEEIGPIAHALEGLLDIVAAEAEGGPTPTQFGLLRNWTRDLLRTIGRHQDAVAAPIAARADLGAIVEDAAALFQAKGDGLGHTIVLSSPAEPVLVAADRPRLESAVRDLAEAIYDREARGRRIDIVLWRSMEQVRLAFVSGPPARRGEDEVCAPPAVRPASPADARFMAALARLRELGAIVESNCASDSGSSLLISLPAAC